MLFLIINIKILEYLLFIFFTISKFMYIEEKETKEINGSLKPQEKQWKINGDLKPPKVM